jgi:hypothetical protein
MGKQEGISWQPVGPEDDLVLLWRVVPRKERDRLVRALRDAGRNQSQLPPGFRMNPWSFGRLPPGVYPYWQRREWMVFALWSIVVIVILAAAIRRNVSYFF